MKQRFKKEERLCSQTEIDLLFTRGESFVIRPFRVRWMRPESRHTNLARVLLTVPKHTIRLATDRNRIKRRMREAYRLNKHILTGSLEDNNLQIVLCITYMAKEIMDYERIQAKIILLLQRLSEFNEATGG